MNLPPDFIFSQNNLQAYVDCPRRFELAYIERRRWPAVQVEPVLEHERHMELGSRFHHMVFQHKNGLQAELLAAGITDPDLLRWWENYLNFSPAELPVKQEAEYELTMPFAGFRLMARYDLLAVETARRMVIIDWKTTIKKTSRAVLTARIQTRLYPFVLANSLALPSALPPDRISMIYWFPDFPKEAEMFNYSAEQMEQDRTYFTGLVESILGTPQGNYALTDNSRACTFCTYRSLCERGKTAGQLDLYDDEGDDGSSLFDEIDLDNIPGIAF